ncbi:MAG: 4Fe-4S binding protein [Bryobacterales bacterium]|nr:4Fe-4S binding protein [Bryobacterales bacterium]
MRCKAVTGVTDIRTPAREHEGVACAVTPPGPAAGERKQKKQYLRRIDPNRSQRYRRATQFAFVLLNVWICTEFLLFVRQFEGYSLPFPVSRPAGVEGWLPIMGLMQTKYAFLTGRIPELHPAAGVLLVSFVMMSLLLRRSFCSWLCPIGTLSEYLWKLGRRFTRRMYFPPRWLDIILRGLKYTLLALFLYAVGTMSAAAIAAFAGSPYGLISDVKMLNFFRYLGLTGGIILVLLTVMSLFTPNFWCRYLCPYGALMGLTSLLSPLRIRRIPEKCIDCAKCARACPSQLPVDRLVQIRSAECLGCMECVASCPVEDALGMQVIGVPASRATRFFHPEWMAAGVVALFLGFVIAAKLTGHWDSAIPHHVYEQLIPMADEFGHP